MSEKALLTCPNKSCEKVFAKPLKTINLQQSSEETYNACPYCLTEITFIEPEGGNPSEETIIEVSSNADMPNQEKELACKYHMGYLNEKERTTSIPDECILCKKIIDCMLEKGEK
jgi:hypothetical protein